MKHHLLSGHGSLDNRPTSRTVRKKTGGSESLYGQIGNHRFAVLVRKCLHSPDFFYFLFFSNCWMVLDLLWQDFFIVTFCLKTCD